MPTKPAAWSTWKPKGGGKGSQYFAGKVARGAYALAPGPEPGAPTPQDASVLAAVTTQPRTRQLSMFARAVTTSDGERVDASATKIDPDGWNRWCRVKNGAKMTQKAQREKDMSNKPKYFSGNVEEEEEEEQLAQKEENAMSTDIRIVR